MADETDPRSRRQQYLAQIERLKQERSTWDPTYLELNDYIRPRASRFFTTDANKGGKREQHIINSTATRAHRIMAAGMLAGVTSPARPWARLTTFDPDLADYDPVKEWLGLAAMRMLALLGRTNIYNAYHGCYLDLGQFGTNAFLLEEDEKTILRAYAQPVGEYVLATDARGEVNTLFRELRMTVSHLVERFKLPNCSPRVRDLYRRGKYHEWIEVVRVIEPRRDYNRRGLGGKAKAIASCWFEKDGGEDLGFLLESGFDESPLIAPRWDVLGEDTYGTGPGHEALGDIKALQLYEKKKARAVELIVDPPLDIDADQEHKGPISTKPGALNYTVRKPGGDPAVRAMIVVPAQVVQVAAASVQEHERRIDGAFGADLWLMMADSGDPQKTAREIAERHEEKMLQLGPVMERLDGELLDKSVARTFKVMLRHAMLPPAPRELQGQPLRVEYMSVMAQAQRMVAGSAVQQLARFVVGYAPIDKSVAIKVKGTKLVTQLSDALGLSPETLRTDEEVQAILQQEAQAAAQQQQAEQAAQAAQSVKALAGADTSKQSALTDLVGAAAAAQASQGAGEQP